MRTPLMIPDRWMLVVPSVIVAVVWLLVYGVHLASMLAGEPSGLAYLPLVLWELTWSSVAAFVVTLPVGVAAFSLILLWRRRGH